MVLVTITYFVREISGRSHCLTVRDAAPIIQLLRLRFARVLARSYHPFYFYAYYTTGIADSANYVTVLTAASWRAAVLFPTTFFESRIESIMIPTIIPKKVSRTAR